jgi:hypothetical protein
MRRVMASWLLRKVVRRIFLGGTPNVESVQHCRDNRITSRKRAQCHCVDHPQSVISSALALVSEDMSLYQRTSAVEVFRMRLTFELPPLSYSSFSSFDFVAERLFNARLV